MTLLLDSFQLNSGNCIPAVGFGTYLIPDDEVTRAVTAAIAAGYRHIDTAAAYSNERGVGKAIASACSERGIEREDIFVTTKFAPGWIGDPPKDKQRTLAEASESLDRLGLDYIDLYLIHAPFGGAERLNQWRALVDVREAGKARSIGVSNYNQAHLNEIRDAGLPMPDANQIELHPWSQKPDLVAYMRDHAIQPIAYSSLVPLSTWRHQDGHKSAKPQAFIDDAGTFAGYAKKYSVSQAQFLLRWGYQMGFAILPKSIARERILENLSIGSFEIDDRDMRVIALMDRGSGVAWEAGDPLNMA